MSGRPDQPHHAALDIRQQHILLCLVEAVDFVDEENGGLPLVFYPVGRGSQDPAHVRHIGFHTAQPLELAPRLAGYDLGEGSLAGTRRPVKDERLDPVGLDGPAQQLPGTEDVGLADKLA